VAGYRGLFDAAKRSAYKSRAWNLDEILFSRPVKRQQNLRSTFSNVKTKFDDGITGIS